jgi:hypothetical protein
MFDNLMRELRALERQSISVPIDSDEKGYIDKECPSSNCEFQFKIKGEDWTNICRDEGVWCPTCGHASPARNWFTKAQVRHAERHARRVIEATTDGAMRADARAFNRRQPKNSFISMSMKVGGSPAFTPHRVPAAGCSRLTRAVQALRQCRADGRSVLPARGPEPQHLQPLALAAADAGPRRRSEPIYAAQLDSIRASRVKAVDETPIMAGPAGPGKMKAGYFWPVYGEHGEVCFPYFDSRRHGCVKELLGDKPQPGGVLLSDGYAAYNTRRRSSPGPRTRASTSSFAKCARN